MTIFILQATYKNTFEKNCENGQKNLVSSHLVADKRFTRKLKNDAVCTVTALYVSV